VKPALGGVILEQVREGSGIRQVVDGRDPDAGHVVQAAKGQAADAAESVDGDTFCHDEVS